MGRIPTEKGVLGGLKGSRQIAMFNKIRTVSNLSKDHTQRRIMWMKKFSWWIKEEGEGELKFVSLRTTPPVGFEFLNINKSSHWMNMARHFAV